MSSEDFVINVSGLGKCYEIYDRPGDRLRQFIYPKLYKLLSKETNNYFQEFWALKNISFKLKRGEVLGIIGRNGCGKSTLLQLICGTLSPSVGQVEISGRIAALLELGSGFNLEFTGRENVFLNAAILGLSQDEITDRYDEIIAFADIGEFINQPVKTYSSGMLVRLAFAVIAHVDADILIIDEALAVGDIFFTQKCIRFLRDFIKKNTVIYVSHDIPSIKNLCSRALWINAGAIISDGDPNIVCDRYIEPGYKQLPNLGLISEATNLGSVAISENRFSAEMGGTSDANNGNSLLSFQTGFRSFGKGGAVITNVRLMNNSSEHLTTIKGGEGVVIEITIKVLDILKSPIVGFYIKDRLGQTLFGDNTYLSYKEINNEATRNQTIKTFFSFTMPILMAGEYTVTVAVADGTQEEHEQHHWVHDAISFISTSNSLSTGIIGIPMNSINMEIMN